jgi:hypothetical protein
MSNFCDWAKTRSVVHLKLSFGYKRVWTTGEETDARKNRRTDVGVRCAALGQFYFVEISLPQNSIISSVSASAADEAEDVVEAIVFLICSVPLFN